MIRPIDYPDEFIPQMEGQLQLVGTYLNSLENHIQQNQAKEALALIGAIRGSMEKMKKLLDDDVGS